MGISTQEAEQGQQHLWMGLLGAFAGLAMWTLFEVLPDAIENQRLLLWIASATLGFFVLVFALLGSLRWKEAAVGAAVLALADAALLFWTSARFHEFDDLFEDSFAPFSWALILLIGAPFASAILTGRARDYAFLFDTAWNIVVRYGAAWVFAALFWGVLFLSDALLSIVGITLIEDVIDLDPVPYLLTGAAVGLAMSVVQDLKAYVSPYLPLRLLRLLLPMVLVVVAVFLLALPLQGLSQLFGDFSAAGILMSVAIAAITLITSALDRSDDAGVQSALMQLATKALALLLPVLSGLALWAIWLRVSDYGWTPERIAASLVGLLVLAYGVLFGLAVLQKSEWRRMIRQSNIAMALTVLVLSAAWMTPLMDAQRYSAQAQLARYMQGELSAEEFPVWEMTHTWGRAGKDVVAQLRDLPAIDHAEIHARLDQAADLSRWEFNQREGTPTIIDLASQMLASTQVWPENRVLAEGYFEGAGRRRLENWVSECQMSEDRPCVLVFGPFARQASEMAMLFIPVPEGGARIYAASGASEKPDYFSDVRQGLTGGLIDEEAYQKVRSGGYRIGPSSRQSLWLGDVELTADN